MKRQLLIICFLLSFIITHAQSFQIKDLAHSVGFWKGQLTYLDYSSGKPYTMQANIRIALTDDKKGWITTYEYPKEPHANSTDTTYLIHRLFGKERIMEFKKDSNHGFVLVTESDGEDGNDHKKAVLKHTYLLRANTVSIKKEVKFNGTTAWIKRNEYVFTRSTD